MVLFSASEAQQTQDVLYLHNGSIIRGTIIQTNDTIVKILTVGDNIFAYSPDQISSIAKEPFPGKDLSIKESGYFSFISAGFLLGSMSNDKPAAFSIMMEHVYKYREKYVVGFILGFGQLKENVLPMGVTFKYMLPVNKSNLIFGLSGAYSYPVEKPDDENIVKVRGGLMFNSEIGMVFPVAESAAFFVAVGYQYNGLNYEIEDYWLSDYKRRIKYNRFSFRTGISIF